jgi:transposase
MARKGVNTSIDQRKLTISYHEEGFSEREIGRILNIPKSTVHDIVRRYKTEDRIHSIPQKGKPRKLTDYDTQFLKREIENNPEVSAPKLSTALSDRKKEDISAETVRRALKRMGCKRSRTARRKKPFISAINRVKRLEFARKYRLKLEKFWSNVIFADEFKYNIVFDGDDKVEVRRKPKNARASAGGSLTVWGCFAAKGVGPLVFIDGTMNAGMYVDILRKNLRQYAKKLRISRSFSYYHDNDPKHRAVKTREWLRHNRLRVLETSVPRRRNCNITENFLKHLTWFEYRWV